MDKESLTQPNMAYTLKELLEKYTSGSLPPVIRKGSYPETEPDLDDPVLLSQERDLTDINVISLRVNELNDIIDEDRRLTEAKQKESEAAKIVNPPA